jgi:hypothetical protein
MLKMRPFETMWSALGRSFADPRLRQLFGRYATYCGSSPFAAPATLMLIAHAEQAGVWSVKGGMHALARAICDLATAKGASFRFNAHVARIRTRSGGVEGIELADGEVVPMPTLPLLLRRMDSTPPSANATPPPLWLIVERISRLVIILPLNERFVLSLTALRVITTSPPSISKG